MTLKIESEGTKKQGLCEVNSQQVNLRRKYQRLQGRLCDISAWYLGQDQVSSPSIRAASRFPMVGFILAVVIYIQWGKKVFSQPPIVQVLPLKKMREACNFHHRYTSTMRDKIRKTNPENHIVGFLKNLFANYGGK